MSPLTLVKALSTATLAGLICAFIGAFFVAQVIRAVIFLVGAVFHIPPPDFIQVASRIVWTSALALAGVALLMYAWKQPLYLAGTNTRVGSLGSLGLLAVIAVSAFELGRGYLSWFVVNFFGDVQIYTTRNQNSQFYDLRERILEKATQVVIRVLAGSPAGRPYERVHILAHSLGSTIAMDAILRIYSIQETASASCNPIVSPNDWLRLRSFVTFGTALEKTKYFFAAWAATPSQEWEQWNAAVYGSIFTADKAVLTEHDGTHGIYWLNNWFFSDFVSDKITTYRSFLLPGEPLWLSQEARREVSDGAGTGLHQGRLVAANRNSFGPWPRRLETHTWYLEGDWFWVCNGSTALPNDPLGTLAVLESQPNQRVIAERRAIIENTPPSKQRSEPVPAWQRLGLRSWEVVNNK